MAEPIVHIYARVIVRAVPDLLHVLVNALRVVVITVERRVLIVATEDATEAAVMVVITVV